MRLAVPIVLASLFAIPAAAEDICRADVNSTEILIDRETLGVAPDAPGLRERASRWAGLGVDRVLGRPPRCDSQTLISFLANEVPDRDLDGYCLLPDERLGFLLVPGERNYRGRCTRTFCDRVNMASGGAANVAGAATDIVTGRDEGESRSSAVLHASGAAIVSGTAGSVLTSLGTSAGTALSAALAAPAVAGGVAVSVVAVGGAVYLCRDGDAAAE
ncbi:hypothetical protein [Palleronia sp. LCG004]|uniref:hypothetical protein n=1 Tax=Palleronia sp. LCG004 TaxID=3079304 RepID=UPI002942B904|nr:hypothetical protein [Palleronia sp. LCG004]WOI54881.1 hypothetical protein RVY76_07335 [Palleronia sp. LCG004]